LTLLLDYLVRSVLFVDPPAFVATVERMAAPALRSRPLAVAPPGADRATVLALSPEAGAWERLQAGAVPVPPFDLVGTAEALHRSLTMPATERAERAVALRSIVESRTPADWLADQLAAADLR